MTMYAKKIDTQLYYIANLGGQHYIPTPASVESFYNTIKNTVGDPSASIFCYTNNAQGTVRSFLRLIGFSDEPIENLTRMHYHFVTAEKFEAFDSEEAKKADEERRRLEAERRQNWRKPGEFRAGDKVYRYRPSSVADWRFNGTVTDVLPSGRIVVNGDCELTPVIASRGPATIQRTKRYDSYW